MLRLIARSSQGLEIFHPVHTIGIASDTSINHETMGRYLGERERAVKGGVIKAATNTRVQSKSVDASVAIFRGVKIRVWGVKDGESKKLRIAK